jgi:hypothetical protein
MTKRPTLPARLDKFMQTWLSNPAAQMDFVGLVEDVHQQPTHDHADHELLEWIDDRHAGLKRIGMR